MTVLLLSLVGRIVAKDDGIGAELSGHCQEKEFFSGIGIRSVISIATDAVRALRFFWVSSAADRLIATTDIFMARQRQ